MNKQQNGVPQGNEKKHQSMRNGSAMSPDTGSFNDEDFMNEDDDDEMDDEHEHEQQQDEELDAEETSDSTTLPSEMKQELNESADAAVKVKCESLNRSAHQQYISHQTSQPTGEMKMSESSSSSSTSSSSSCSNQTDLDEENNSSIFLTPSSLSVTTSTTTNTINTTSNESTSLITSKTPCESDSANKQTLTLQDFSLSSSTSAISPSYSAQPKQQQQQQQQQTQTALFYSNQPNVNTYQMSNSNFNSFSDRSSMMTTNYNTYLNQSVPSSTTTSTNYANPNQSQFNLYNLNMIQPLSCSSPSSSKLNSSLPYGYTNNNVQNSNQTGTYLNTYNSQQSFNYSVPNYAYPFNSQPQSISTGPASNSIYTHPHHQLNTPASYLPSSATIQHSIWNNSN